MSVGTAPGPPARAELDRGSGNAHWSRRRARRVPSLRHSGDERRLGASERPRRPALRAAPGLPQFPPPVQRFGGGRQLHSGHGRERRQFLRRSPARRIAAGRALSRGASSTTSTSRTTSCRRPTSRRSRTSRRARCRRARGSPEWSGTSRRWRSAAARAGATRESAAVKADDGPSAEALVARAEQHRRLSALRGRARGAVPLRGRPALLRRPRALGHRGPQRRARLDGAEPPQARAGEAARAARGVRRRVLAQVAPAARRGARQSSARSRRGDDRRRPRS